MNPSPSDRSGLEAFTDHLMEMIPQILGGKAMDKLGGSWASAVITCCISVIFEDLEMDGCVFFFHNGSIS